MLGIAVTYSALGVGAALTGQAFGSVMQNGWVMGGVALVLVVMAASMFGAFELSLPASLQQRLSGVGGAGRAGAFGMGLVAGVIAAPCTGPVLAAALTFIAAKGSVGLGLAIMFPYALGMGLLFFLIGAFSVSLPKSGAWMETVKSVFGAALLAMAGIYLKDLVPGLKPLFSAAPAAALLAAAAAGGGVLLGALHLGFHGPARERVVKAIGVAMLVGGIVYGAGAAGARGAGPGAAASFTWLHSEPEAVALARAERRPVIVDFWAEWCTACKELDRTAWADPRVREEAARFVTVKVDGTESTDEVAAIHERYQVQGMPTVVFIDSHGARGAGPGHRRRRRRRDAAAAPRRPVAARRGRSPRTASRSRSPAARAAPARRAWGRRRSRPARPASRAPPAPAGRRAPPRSSPPAAGRSRRRRRARW